MSYAPPQRKSALARAKAVSNAAVAREARQRSTPAPAPHRVVLRVKRKRSDAAVENLLVTTTNDDGGVTLPDRKRRVTIEETLADLSLNQHRNYAADTEVLAGTSIVPPLSTTSHPPQQRLFFKRVRTTESERSRRREGNPAPPAVKAAGAAAASEQATTTSATADGMGAGQAAGGRLDTFAGSNANMSSAVSTASCNIVDYLEVRRIKAKGVPAISTAAAGGGESASRDDDTSQPSSSSRVGSSALEADYHVIDLHPIPREVDGIVMADAGGMVGVGGKRGAPAVAATSNSHAQAAPVLNPVERQMDEAIFKAFRSGDLSGIRQVVASCPSSNIVNYSRRLGDGTTALMAAAFHGDLDTVRYLLSLGGKASLADAGGRSAALLAGMHGHRECFAELQRTADEENVRSSGRKPGGVGSNEHGDFVYDLYYFEPSPAPDARQGGECDMVVEASERGGATSGGAGPPVVRLSGIGPIDANAMGVTIVAGLELEFEHDSDWSGLGEDDGEDPDSNSEGYYGNDYPEDEDGENDAGAPCLYVGSSCESEEGSSSADPRSGDDSDHESNNHRRTLRSVYGRAVSEASARNNIPTNVLGNFAVGDMDKVAGIGATSSLKMLVPGSSQREGGGVGVFGGDGGVGKEEVFAWDRSSGGLSDQGMTVEGSDGVDGMMGGDDSGSDDMRSGASL